MGRLHPKGTQGGKHTGRRAAGYSLCGCTFAVWLAGELVQLGLGTHYWAVAAISAIQLAFVVPLVIGLRRIRDEESRPDGGG